MFTFIITLKLKIKTTTKYFTLIELSKKKVTKFSFGKDGNNSTLGILIHGWSLD